MKWELNKWQFVFDNNPDHNRMESGWRWLRVGLVKLKEIPKDGEALQGKMYKGLILRVRYFFPIDRIYLD